MMDFISTWMGDIDGA